MAKKNNAINKRGVNIPLYPVMDSQFQVKVNTSILKINTTYLITGWGYGKYEKNNPRPQYWIMKDIQDTKEKPTKIQVWKNDIQKIYNQELIRFV